MPGSRLQLHRDVWLEHSFYCSVITPYAQRHVDILLGPVAPELAMIAIESSYQ